MKTLADRIRWILANRDLGQRELARNAGLKDPHVAVILHRLEKDPGRQIEADTLAAIARAGRVSIRWLATGQGSPDEIGEVPANDAPKFANLPGWEDAERAAREHNKRLPAWAFDIAREMSGLVPPGGVTPDFVLHMAIAALTYGQPNEAMDAEDAAIDAEMAAARAKQEKKLERQRKAAKKK